MIAWLQEKCTGLRDGLVEGNTATAEEVAEVWPGGALNPGRNLKAWITCSNKLHAICARIALKMSRGLENDAERKAAILAALADTPETVTLAGLTEDGEPQYATVYPKSYVALLEIHKRNLMLGVITDGLGLLRERGTADDLELIARIFDEQTYLQRVLAWIATTPGPGLPFGEQTPNPTPPALYSSWHPTDFYAVAAAFQRVNVLRLTLLDQSQRSESRPDWSVFFAMLAGDNRPTPVVMRDTSLAVVLSQAAERSRGHQQATATAERQRKQKVA